MDTRIYVLGAIIVLFSVFLSLVVKVQDNNDLTRQEAQVFTIVLIVLNVLLVVASLVQLVLAGKLAWSNSKESAIGLRYTRIKKHITATQRLHNNSSN
jgi:ABC-type transporter Mla maintaining outer membrane lipid asymmetry permease subunit MlaE